MVRIMMGVEHPSWVFFNSLASAKTVPKDVLDAIAQTGSATICVIGRPSDTIVDQIKQVVPTSEVIVRDINDVVHGDFIDKSIVLIVDLDMGPVGLLGAMKATGQGYAQLDSDLVAIAGNIQRAGYSDIAQLLIRGWSMLNAEKGSAYHQDLTEFFGRYVRASQGGKTFPAWFEHKFGNVMSDNKISTTPTLGELLASVANFIGDKLSPPQQLKLVPVRIPIGR